MTAEPAVDRARRRPNVVLTGFMGTGKTTVGRLVATALGHVFVDTDAIIEERFGPIPTIFAEHGEGAFRQHEREVADELARRDGLVISTGGRLLLDAANARALGASGTVFCLTAGVDTILARLTADVTADRPLLAGPDVRDRIEMLLDERAVGYARFEQVPTDGRTPEAVAADVIDRLAGQHRPGGSGVSGRRRGG